MARLPDTYRAVVIDQQRQLELLIRKAGLGPVRRMYQDMLDGLTKRMRATTTGTLTHMQIQGLMAQVKLGLAGVMRQMVGSFGDAAFQVGVQGARSMLENVAQLEKHFSGALIPLPLAEAARLHGLVADEMPSLMRAHQTSMARYGVHLVGQMETALGASISVGETPLEAIDRVRKVGDMEWWRAERIVRTELSYASHASARRAADEQAHELGGDLWTRWTEHVTNGGEPLDDRVGVDSEAMHGQVAPPGGDFTQPPTSPDGEKVSESLAEKTWKHPPNRPNDRAVLVPWRVGWDVPGWVWRGRRVPATTEIVGRANAVFQSKHGRRAAEDAEPDQERTASAEARHTPAVALPHGPHGARASVQVPPRFASITPEAQAIEKSAAERVAPIAAQPTPEISATSILAPLEAAVEAPDPVALKPKNQKRIEAAKKAAQASVERRREIYSAVKSNLPKELHVVWEKEGHKFLQQEAGRITGVKDHINAASKISEAFSETYGSGAETVFGNEGDRFFKRAEIEAQHAETWANDQERKYYEEMKREAIANGEIDERGELTHRGRERLESAKDDLEPPSASNTSDEDPPF